MTSEGKRCRPVFKRAVLAMIHWPLSNFMCFSGLTSQKCALKMRFASVWGGGSTVRDMWRGGRVNCLSWKNWKWCTRHSFERFFKALINLCLPIWLLLIWVRCRSTNVSPFSSFRWQTGLRESRWALPNIFSAVDKMVPLEKGLFSCGRKIH